MELGAVGDGKVWFGALAREAQGVAAGGDRPGQTSQMILLGVGLVFFGILSWQIKRIVDAAWAQAQSGSEE